jgi:hypothetical protein
MKNNLYNQYVHFGVLQGAGNAVKKLFGDGDVALSGAAKIPKAGLLDRALAFGTLASIPIGIGAVALPSADTRAVNAMRTEDKAREAQGLPQLSATSQLLKEKAQQMSQTMNNGATRVTNMNPNQIPAPGLPPRSMM